MMRLRLLALALPALASGALLGARPASPAPAQEPADLEAVLVERVRAAEQLGEDEFWREVSSTTELVSRLEPAEAERAVQALLSGGAALGDRGRLLLAVVQLSGDDPDLDALAERLTALLGSDDGEVARGAAGLVADVRFRELDEERAEGVLAALLAGATDRRREPQTRMELAVTAYQLGGATEKRKAREEMRAFLDSQDARLRGLAALALARVGDVDTARGELERMARLPGADGRLADSYLKADYQRDYFEEKLRKSRERISDVLDGEKLPKDLDLVEALIRRVQTRYIEGDKLTREQLIDAALDGMLQSLDPHSSYLPSELFSKFEFDLEGEYGGIGAYVQEDPNDRLFTITRPIYSGPAYKANLRSDDKIVQVDDWPTVENGRSKPTDDIIAKLKGKPGTTVRLYIWRSGMDPVQITRPTEDMVVEVTRALITVPPMRADLLPGGIGLVELDTFSGVASQELGYVLRAMVQGGVKGVILDLRNNSGGLLTEAQAVADLFLPKGKLVVTTEDRVRPPEQLFARRDPIVPEDMPVAVLINRFSASASEIVAGALRDHGRATLVGERSYGKGSVQNLIPMGKDDAFDDENGNGRHDSWEPLTADWNKNGKFDFAPRAKLTVARWLIPSGQSIHRELDDEGNLVSLGGIEPDFEVEARRWDAWRLEEVRKLVTGRKVREWVQENWPAHKELFQELALNDRKDPSLYPGFQQLYDSLETVLPPDDVRFLVRSEVRRLVQDERGSAFPMGDYQEDVQLQRAIAVVLDELGRAPSDYEEYLLTFEDLGATGGERETAVASSEHEAERQQLRDALALLTRASQGDEELTRENLAHLRELLIKLDR